MSAPKHPFQPGPTPVTPPNIPSGYVPYYSADGTFQGYVSDTQIPQGTSVVIGNYSNGQPVFGGDNVNAPPIPATPPSIAPSNSVTSGNSQPTLGAASSQTPPASNPASNSPGGSGAVQGPPTPPPEITQGGSTGGGDSGTSGSNTGTTPSTNSLTGTPGGSAGTSTSGLSTGSGTGNSLSPNDVSGSSSTTLSPTPQNFSTQLNNAIQDNVLNNFYQPTYHFRLFATGDEDILTQANNSLANISGKQVNQITIAESGVTGFNIRDVEITTVAAQTNMTGNMTGNNIVITIVDPLGMSFLDGLNDAVTLLKVKNLTKSVYYLELKFVGYDNSGNFVNAAANLPNNGIWIWAITITKIITKLNEGGGIFTLQCVPLQNIQMFHSISDFLNVPQQGLTVSGTTVQGIFADFVTKINAAWLQQYSSSGGPALIALQPIVTTPIKQGPPAVIGKDPGTFPLPFQNPEQSSQRSIEFTAGKGVVTCHLTPGTSIGDFIAATINHTEAGQALLKGEPAITRKDQTDTQSTPQNFRESILFSTEYDVKNVGYDPNHQMYRRQVTVRLVDHYTQEVIASQTQVNNAQNPTTQQQSIQAVIKNGMLKKRYDFIFTGKNTEVLEYNIDWDMPWMAVLPKLDGARMSIDNAEVHATINQNQKTGPQCDLPEAWQIVVDKSLTTNSVLNQTNPTPGTSSAFQPQSTLLTTNQTSGGLNWNTITSPIPNLTSLGPASNPVSISTQKTLQGYLNSNDPFFNAMSGNLKIANAANSTPPIAATTQKIASSTTPTPEIPSAANGNNVYIEDIEDRINQNSNTSVAQLPIPVSFWHGYMETNYDATSGYTGPYHRDLSVTSALTSQVHGDDGKPLMTGKFQLMDMTIRGDPFWLGQTNLDRQLIIRTNASAVNPSALPDYSTSKPLIVFYMKYPLQIGDDSVPILKSTNLLNGIYQITRIVHTFSEGMFKQKLEGNRQQMFDLNLALTASSTGIMDSGASSSPQLATAGTATSTGGNVPGTTSSGPSLTPTGGGLGQVTPTAIQSNDPTTIGNLSADQTASLKAAIGQQESGNNPLQGNNGKGYIGQYQFGQSALTDTGYVVNNSGTSNQPSTWSWTGQNNINSVSDFLNSPTEQNNAMNSFMQQNYNTLSNNGTITASTPSNQVAGLIAASQLGAGSATNFANGNGNPSDAFGFNTQKWYNLGYNSLGKSE